MSTRLTGASQVSLILAAARAIGTADRTDPVDDPFAHLFVAATTHIRLPRHASEVPRESAAFWERLIPFVSRRTLTFDSALLDAARAGCTQIVKIGAGLDTRAYRLPWPGGTRVIEVERAPVLDFKAEVLRRAGVEPVTDRVSVPVELTDDWSPALRRAGFRETKRAAWLIEGLLPFVSADDETSIMHRVAELSAPGSRVIFETARLRDESMIDVAPATLVALLDRDPHPDSVAELRRRGFEVRSESVSPTTWHFAELPA